MKSSNPNSVRFKKAAPTRALLFGSMSCEQTTAAIRNKTVDAMEANEVRAVAYRYLQSRHGQNKTFFEITLWSLVALALSYTLYELRQGSLSAACNSSNKDNCENYINKIFAMLSVLFLIAPLANIAPNVFNTLRYKETKNACADWLTGKLGDTLFKQIESSDYSYTSLNALEKLLNKKNIPKTQAGFKSKRQL